MAVENETILMKLLEELKESTRRIEAESKETNRKLDKFIETTSETLTKIQVNQARLEGKVETLQVEVQNVKETVRDIKSTEKWVITVVVTLIGIVGTIFLRTFNLLPKG